MTLATQFQYMKVSWALQALRCGQPIRLVREGCVVAFVAVEVFDFFEHQELSEDPSARVFVGSHEGGGVFSLREPQTPLWWKDLSDLKTLGNRLHRTAEQLPLDVMEAITQLMRWAHLLPAVVMLPARSETALDIALSEIEAFSTCLNSPRVIAMPSVALLTPTGVLRMHPCRCSLGQEHMVVEVGEAPNGNTDCPLVRVHSSCITGDMFQSLHCDCGEQLRRSLEMMRAHGHGFLIYLNQEGRKIGFVNKMRAYILQKNGVNTYEANTKLGFEKDARYYAIAGSILKSLNVSTLDLLTNNPLKCQALMEVGIRVRYTVPLKSEPTEHNSVYLQTKAANGRF